MILFASAIFGAWQTSGVLCWNADIFQIISGLVYWRNSDLKPLIIDFRHDMCVKHSAEILLIYSTRKISAFLNVYEKKG